MKNLLIAISILTVVSCKKDNPPNTPVSPSLISHFNYQAGTYWVYLDSITGAIDSFYVTSNNLIPNMPFDPTDNSRGTFSQYNINISERTISPNLGSISNQYIFLRDKTMSISGFTPSSYDLIKYPFVLNDQVVSNIDVGTIIKINSNYSLNGQSYSNVAVTNHTETSQNYNDSYYISDSVGIVKMILSHPSEAFSKDWELLRYNIVK